MAGSLTLKRVFQADESAKASLIQSQGWAYVATNEL